jgi:uncharacterized RDD family membrane protein YckC
MLAAALDVLALTPIFALTGIVVAAAFGGRIPRLREVGLDYLVEMLVGRSRLVVGGTTLCVCLAIGYFALAHAVRGQTFGEALCRIRLLTASAERPSLPRSLLRTMASLASLLLCGLGFIWIAFDAEKRGLHDWIAGTYVVLEK